MNRAETMTPIIGMSPGNGYFKDDEVRYLLNSVVEKYGKTVVLIADIPAISTYIALGYPENRARRDKALPQGNNLRNRTRRIADELGYSEELVRIIDWETEIETNTEYVEVYKKVQDLYNSNSDFEKAADETTKNVLEFSEKKITDIDTAVKTAVHYLLSEIAFLEFAPKFLNTSKVSYVYHRNWPVYENYISGKFDGNPKPYMDFILLENPYETYTSLWDADEGEMGTNTLENVSKTHVLRASFTNYNPAFIHKKETNEFSGIFHDVLQQIAENNGWHIRWKEETGYGVIVDGLKAGRFDIFASTVWPTPEREKEADFSIPLYMSKAYIWAKGDVDLNSPDIRVAIKERDISHSIASADFPHSRLVRVPQLTDTEELLQFVADGKADITFVEEVIAEQFNMRSEVKVKKVSEEPVREFGNTFMIRKGDLDFKTLLDNEIQVMLDSGYIKDLIKKYTGDINTFE